MIHDTNVFARKRQHHDQRTLDELRGRRGDNVARVARKLGDTVFKLGHLNGLSHLQEKWFVAFRARVQFLFVVVLVAVRVVRQHGQSLRVLDDIRPTGSS